MSRLVRVLVADDHPLMLEAVTGRLTRSGDIEVVGTASNGDELVEAWRQLRPDVVLTDFSMPGTPTPDAIRAVLAEDPAARVLVLSAYEEPGPIQACLKAGAVGYIVKSIPGPELAARVVAAASGDYVLDAAATRAVAAGMRAPAEAETALSPREREVIAGVSEGLSNKEIGARLYISAETVKTHLERAFAKLGVTDRSAAVRVAMERHLLD